MIIDTKLTTFFSLMSFSQFSQVSQILLPWTVLRVSDLKITSGKGFSIWIGCFGSPMRTIWAPCRIKISLHVFSKVHHRKNYSIIRLGLFVSYLFTFRSMEKQELTTGGKPLASTSLAIPLPSVSFRTSSFRTFSLELIVTVAPIFFASSKRESTTSAAMTLVAP